MKRVQVLLDGNKSIFSVSENEYISHAGGKKYLVCTIDDKNNQSITRVFNADTFFVSECCKGTESGTENCACSQFKDASK